MPDYQMPSEVKAEIEVLADQIEPCGEPAPYGGVCCDREAGHGGTRHWCLTLNWPAA